MYCQGWDNSAALLYPAAHSQGSTTIIDVIDSHVQQFGSNSHSRIDMTAFYQVSQEQAMNELGLWRGDRRALPRFYSRPEAQQRNKVS